MWTPIHGVAKRVREGARATEVPESEEAPPVGREGRLRAAQQVDTPKVLEPDSA